MDNVENCLVTLNIDVMHWKNLKSLILCNSVKNCLSNKYDKMHGS